MSSSLARYFSRNYFSPTIAAKSIFLNELPSRYWEHRMVLVRERWSIRRNGLVRVWATIPVARSSKKESESSSRQHTPWVFCSKTSVQYLQRSLLSVTLLEKKGAPTAISLVAASTLAEVSSIANDSCWEEWPPRQEVWTRATHFICPRRIQNLARLNHI